MTCGQLSSLGQSRMQSRGIKQAERRCHQLALVVTKIAKDAEVMPVADEQRALTAWRVALRPAFPHEPRLADEFAGLVGTGHEKKRRRRAKLQMNGTQSVRAGRVELEVDIK